VRSIALEAGLQNRKENTASSARLFDFALDRPATVRSIALEVRSIAPLQNKTKILKKISNTKI
jgi:hypothetical protein